MILRSLLPASTPSQPPHTSTSSASCCDSTRNEPNQLLCNRPRPPPARRRTCTTVLGNTWILLCLIFFTLSSHAQEIYEVDLYAPVPRELLFDIAPAPKAHLHMRHLEARQTTVSTLQPTFSFSLGSDATETSSILSTTTTTSTSISASATPTSSPPLAPDELPQPFDTSLGANFTSPNCPQFFNTFLNNEDFKSCLPLSLLLQNSASFFNVLRSPSQLTQTLTASCSVNSTLCSTLMSTLAREIQLDANCGSDFSLHNPAVTQAYAGFIAYQPLYHAGCLTTTTSTTSNSSTSSGSSGDGDGPDYCFTTAVTNQSSPASSYIYYLPLGVSLPSGSQPACTTCLQNTMAVFAQAAGNKSVPLAQDYGAAAGMIDGWCGSGFVLDRVSSAGGRITMGWWLGVVVVVGVMVVEWM